jgi:hypothetical protein
LAAVFPQFPENLGAAPVVHVQLRIVGDTGAVFADSYSLRLENSRHRLDAAGLSINEGKTLQKCLRHQVVSAKAATFVNRHRRSFCLFH